MSAALYLGIDHVLDRATPAGLRRLDLNLTQPTEVHQVATCLLNQLCFAKEGPLLAVNIANGEPILQFALPNLLGQMRDSLLRDARDESGTSFLKSDKGRAWSSTKGGSSRKCLQMDRDWLVPLLSLWGFLWHDQCGQRSWTQHE